MHRRQRRKKPGEGWPVAAAVAVVAAACLALYFANAPKTESILPVHAVPDAVFLAQKLDINRASADELMDLPGIGGELAARIVDCRDAYGAFDSIDELMNVSGIGEARLEALQNLIFIG